MKLHHNTSDTKMIFTAHGDNYVEVSHQRFEQPVVVIPERVLTDWPAQTFDTLDATHFDYFLALQPEILLFGTGKQQQFPPPRLYRTLTAKGISVEFMSTAAACRTYNILMNEDRKVAAAIL